MAGKRNATTDLNHDNWDQEDEQEDAGSFKKASEDVLKQRVIKVARRRNIGSSNNDEENKGIFGGFTAFSTAKPPASSAFSFLSNLNQPKVNGLDKPSSQEATPASIPTTNSSQKSADLDKSDQYLAKLKGLNQSVSKWISKHVEENPLIDLTPIFRDYEKYLDKLEDNKTMRAEKEVGEAEPRYGVSSSKESLTPKFSFGIPNKACSDSPKASVDSSAAKTETSVTSLSATTPKFSFGIPSKSSLETKAESPKFSFGSLPSNSSAKPFAFGSANTKTTSPGFPTFNSGTNSDKGFSFASLNKIPEKKEEHNAEENADEDEPPKVEFTKVVEEDHIYTIRCKVFVKKDGKFGDRGVGSLYLKPIPSSGKTQVIVRADTNLGNLLCNFILSESIPTQRMGKKDVMLVCLPMPDSKPPPLPVLFRVKSPEEADELLRKLDENKK